MLSSKKEVHELNEDVKRDGAVIHGKNITLYPTNTCFDDAMDHLQELVNENPARRYSGEYVLVHGILDNGDHQYAHAWLETDQWAIDGRYFKDKHVMCEFDKKGYYLELNVVEKTVYTVQQTLAMNLKHGTFGPWEEKYRKLCKPREIRKHIP